jgi:hypothetical protein
MTRRVIGFVPLVLPERSAGMGHHGSAPCSHSAMRRENAAVRNAVLSVSLDGVVRISPSDL